MSANFSGILKPPFVIPEIQGWQGYTVLGLIGFMLIALVAELAPPYLVMMGTLVIFLALSILDVNAAFHGFADEAMLSVAVLFVVAKGIEQSGGLEYVASVLFRTPDKTKELLPGLRSSKTEGSIVWVLLKFSVPVAIFSAFLANIPLVAMMIPPIVEFAKKMNLPPSKMLMPLSYAAQLGGTMTLIGASTNLVVLSMAAQKLPEMKMNLFEIGIIGVPVTIAGIFYIIAFSGKLLPDRLALQPTTLNAREYNVVLVMKPTSSLARKSVEKSGINRQPGLTLLSIHRDGIEITSPTPDLVLLPKDRLHFVGVVDSVLLLVQLNGLVLFQNEGLGEVNLNRLKRTQSLVEAVVASESPMVHKCVADLEFRHRYKAAVVAVHRYGTRLSSAIGEIKLVAGDCLLLLVDGAEFVNNHRNSSTFALVAQLPGFKPLNRRKAAFAAVLVLALVVASGVGIKLITAALFSAAGLLITKCLSPRDAMESIELPVLIMIAAAFGIAEGMVESGAATMLAKALMGLAGKSLFGLVTCTYVATTFFSLAITNSAAVTIMFPVALAAANHQKLDFRPFAYILMMAASAGFMTPTGCPTNLMVYTPGGYKFSDYIFYGGPMQILLLLVTVGITMTAKYWFIWWILITIITLISIPLIARHKSTHPKQTSSPAPASLPPDVKPSTSGSDAENPKAPLNAGNADSSSLALTYTTAVTGDVASSSHGSSDSQPRSSPVPSPEASAPLARNKGSESLSSQFSGSPSLLMAAASTSTSNSNIIDIQHASTAEVFPVSSTASSSLPPTQSLLDSASSLSLSHLTNILLPKTTLELTEHHLTIFPATGASVSKSPSPKPSALPTEDTSWPKPSIPILQRPSSEVPNLTTHITSSGPVFSSTASNQGPEKLLFKPASLQTQIAPSPGPVSLSILSTATSPAFVRRTASLPASITRPLTLNYTSMSMPSSSSTPAASFFGIEPSCSPISMPTTSNLGSGQGSKLTTSPMQQPPTFVTVPKPTSGQGTAVVESASLHSQSSTPKPEPPLTRTASLSSNKSPSPSPVSTSMASSLQTPGALTARKEPSAPVMHLVPVSKPTPSIPGEGTVAAGSTSLLSQYSPHPTEVAVTIVGIPGPGAVASQRASLLSKVPSFITQTSSIPTIEGPGTAAVKSANLTPPDSSPPISIPVPIPVLPGPEALAAGKRANMIPPEPPPPPIPVSIPIPSIPGPGTAAAKRASSIWKKQSKGPSVMGQEKPPPIPQSTGVPTADRSTDAVGTSFIPLIDNNSRVSSMPIVVKTNIPKRPSDVPSPPSGSKNDNGQALENRRSRKFSITNESQPSKPEPLFFTTPTPSSKPPRRLTPPPWVNEAQHSPSAGEPNKRRPSKIVEEDLTGGISDLMTPRRLSSMKDVDAFADRWLGTTT